MESWEEIDTLIKCLCYVWTSNIYIRYPTYLVSRYLWRLLVISARMLCFESFVPRRSGVRGKREAAGFFNSKMFWILLLKNLPFESFWFQLTAHTLALRSSLHFWELHLCLLHLRHLLHSAHILLPSRTLQNSKSKKINIKKKNIPWKLWENMKFCAPPQLLYHPNALAETEELHFAWCRDAESYHIFPRHHRSQIPKTVLKKQKKKNRLF